ncbi:hypothetical protein ABZ883_00445 [Streptomyces sp. NPDC046977]|uniref:8-oxoguanine DNA glycosylase OGG fold protein n=1 Tax=Streptomyces sp. NPDC046977 TaxID=3154703 RepID=UPI003402E248
MDAGMLERPLPPDAVVALESWLAGDGAFYAHGTGTHAVGYIPAAWADIEAWPASLADRTQKQRTLLSRAEVLMVARAGWQTSNWTETFVASYIWGQGSNGYAAYRLSQLLGPATEEVLTEATKVLANDGAVVAYNALRGAICGLGPAFFTKFLYFAGSAISDLAGPAPLILDQRIARVVRAYATRLGGELGLEEPARLAKWLWSDGGWTAYRYNVYLRWAHGAAEQLACTTLWSETPDSLELALFSGVWDPERSALKQHEATRPEAYELAATQCGGDVPGMYE